MPFSTPLQNQASSTRTSMNKEAQRLEYFPYIPDFSLLYCTFPVFTV
jgi:hypothetical protein